MTSMYSSHLRASLFALPFVLVACVGDTATQTPPNDAAPPNDTGVAVDAGSDVLPACGAPGTPCCNGTCNGGSVCNGTVCACNAPTTACGAACVNLTNDGKNCGACGHDCLGGTCTAGKCQPVTIATGQAMVNGVAIDSAGVYWTRGGTNTVAGALVRAKLDGTNLTPLASAGTSESCFSPAVGGGFVYFSQTGSGTRAIMKCALPNCTGGATLVSASQTLAQGIAVDTANNRLYWVDGTPYQGTGGAVMTFPLPSGPAARVVTADQPSPTGLALANGFVYWINAGTYLNNLHQGNGGVRRAPIGQTNGTATPIATNSGADMRGLAVDTQSVYFGSGGNSTLEVAPANGGGSSSTLANVPGGLGDVAADGTNVYWVESATNGRVLTCPRTGCPNGTPIVLAVAQNDPRAIAIDAVSIVWGNSGGGEVRRLAK